MLSSGVHVGFCSDLRHFEVQGDHNYQLVWRDSFYLFQCVVRSLNLLCRPPTLRVTLCSSPHTFWSNPVRRALVGFGRSTSGPSGCSAAPISPISSE